MFILTSGGTTVIEMARLLPESLRATFFTGSIPAAYEYAQHPNIEVIFIGDKISKGSQITVGGEAINKINSIKPDLCFLGINAINEEGITEGTKRILTKASKKIQAEVDILKGLMFYTVKGSGMFYPITLENVKMVLEMNANGKKPG